MTTIIATFNQRVQNNREVEKTSNYSITAGPTAPTILAVTRLNDYQVQIEFDMLRIGGAYTLAISNVSNIWGTAISPSSTTDFVGDDHLPKLLSIAWDEGFTWVLEFDMPMDETTAENVANYSVTGETSPVVLTATLTDPTHVSIELNSELWGGGNYNVAVASAVLNAAGNAIDGDNDELDFVGNGSLPRVYWATAIDYKTIQVNFNESMKDGSGTTALTRVENYILTCPPGGVVTIDSVIKNSATEVLLNLNTGAEMVEGTNNYTVRVENVQDLISQTIDPANDEDTFNGLRRPRVTLAEPDWGFVDITFSIAMNDSGLTTPGNYSFTSGDAGVSASTVDKLSSTKVRVYISGEMKTGTNNYNVAVANLTSANGAPVNPSYDDVNFNGVGVHPVVSSATAINPTTVQVQFSENMADAGLTTDGNYQFACPAGATITVGSVARVGGSSSAVNITVVGEMRTGFDNYTLTVTLSSVTDVVGNPILSSNTDTFNGNGIKPQLTGASDVDANTIDLTFDEEVDETTAETAGNYTVSGAGNPAVSTATKTAATTVRLELATDMTQGTVTVTVSQSVTDLVGNPMDAGADEDSFDVDYAGPTLQSVAIVDHGHLPSWYTIELTFDENLKDEAAVTTESNYTITGPARGYPAYNPDTAVFGATHKKVRLTVNKELCNGESYTVECINLHDEGDRDLVDGTANFTGAEGAKPMVDDMRSAFVDTIHIGVYFGENMRSFGVNSNYLVRKNGTETTIAVVDYSVIADDALVLELATPAELSTYYDVIVDNSSVTDLAGNYVEPLGDTLLLISPAE